MPDQNIKLKLGVDTSEVERAFSSLIKKIQSDADKLKISPTAAKAAPGVDTVREASQVNRNLENKVRQEKAGLDLINRELAKKEAAVQRIQRAQDASNKSLEREIQLKNQLTRAERELEEKKNVARIQQTNYDRTVETANRTRGIRSSGSPVSGGTAGSGGMPTGGITSIGGLASAIGGPAVMAVGGLATAVAAGSAAESIRKFFSEAKYRAQETQATAFQMQGQGGQRLQSILNGGASEEILFDPLRNQAAKNAENQMKMTMESSFRIFTRPLQTILGRAGNGYEGGNQFGFGSEDVKNKIDAEQALERAGMQEKNFQALKTGPEGALRSAVGNKYLRDYQRNLDFQRQTGQSESAFRGFLGGINNTGFTDEQGMGMTSNILGSGGSTRSATGNAALGLQAQRNLDITNAGSIIGKLSGSMGAAETSKEAFVKILAEGTKVGLDGSQFREENRRFVESAADVISKSGTTSASGIDQILSQFGRFFGDKTNTGIEAGKGAYDLYRQTSMATTGPRGTMRAAGMLTDPTISKLSRDAREALFNMPIDQLTSDNPAIVAMAKQAGSTPQQLIDAQNKVTANSTNLFKNSDTASKNLENIKKKYGATSAMGLMAGPYSQNAYDEMTTALGESNIAQIKEHPELGQNQRLTSAYSDALSSGDAQKQNKILEDAKKQQLETTTTGRPGDETNKQQAEASRLANELFTTIQGDLGRTSEAVKVFTSDINALVAAIKSGQNPGTAINAFNAKYPGMASPSTAPSAGSPNSGGGNGR